MGILQAHTGGVGREEEGVSGEGGKIASRIASPIPGPATVHRSTTRYRYMDTRQLFTTHRSPFSWLAEFVA